MSVLARVRTVLADGQFTVVVVWRVPDLVSPSVHRFRYRLVSIEDGLRVVGFDNERGNRPNTIAVLRHMALDVMQQEGSQGSLRRRFNRAGWDEAHLSSLPVQA